MFRPFSAPLRLRAKKSGCYFFLPPRRRGAEEGKKSVKIRVNPCLKKTKKKSLDTDEHGLTRILKTKKSTANQLPAIPSRSRRLILDNLVKCLRPFSAPLRLRAKKSGCYFFLPPRRGGAEEGKKSVRIRENPCLKNQKNVGAKILRPYRSPFTDYRTPITNQFRPTISQMRANSSGSRLAVPTITPETPGSFT